MGLVAEVLLSKAVQILTSNDIRYKGRDTDNPKSQDRES